MAALKNARHEKFAQEVGKGCSAAQAYRNAGYKDDPGHATRLAKNGSIADRIAELKDKAADKAMISIVEILSELKRIGLSSERDNDRIRALELLGKHVGMWRETQPGASAETPLMVKWLD